VKPSAKKLRVEYWPISKLVPYPNNPRDNDASVGRMRDSIKEFGFRIPIIATSKGDIVDGHLRLKAALALGLETVPVTLADELSETQIKAFRLTANHSANWATWNPDMLQVELEELEKLDFDISRFGLDEIDLPELDEIEVAQRTPRKKTTIFVSVRNSDAERSRKAIAAALNKLGVEHNL
jgi:ParB-like chromosome segregation protein Spo0J